MYVGIPRCPKNACNFIGSAARHHGITDVEARFLRHAAVPKYMLNLLTRCTQVMADRNTPASSRVAAASKILDTAFRAVEIEQIEQRLAALEARANQ